MKPVELSERLLSH